MKGEARGEDGARGKKLEVKWEEERGGETEVGCCKEREEMKETKSTKGPYNPNNKRVQ